jgi:hypothetical protein
MAKKKKKKKTIPAHKMVDLPIKAAKIDLLMVPVLNWLNSFQDVQTYSCCEGYEESELTDEPDECGRTPCHEPYVGFTCHSMESLIAILQRVEADDGDAETIVRGEVDWYSNGNSGLGRMQFTLRFYNKQRLRDFIKTRLIADRYRAKMHRLGFIK